MDCRICDNDISNKKDDFYNWENFCKIYLLHKQAELKIHLILIKKIKTTNLIQGQVMATMIFIVVISQWFLFTALCIFTCQQNREEKKRRKEINFSHKKIKIHMIMLKILLNIIKVNLFYMKQFHYSLSFFFDQFFFHIIFVTF